MKKHIILSTICLLLFSCSITKKPEFVGVENIQLLEHTSQQIVLSADAWFKNPNHIGGELSTDGIDVFINDNNIATISTTTFKVPKKDVFSIPLTTKIPTDSLFSDNSLTRFLQSFISKKITVQYKGDIKYKIYNFSNTYHIDETENIKIKL